MTLSATKLSRYSDFSENNEKKIISSDDSDYENEDEFYFPQSSSMAKVRRDESKNLQKSEQIKNYEKSQLDQSKDSFV